MKKLLIPCFILLSFAAHAQLNNSWIDYSKTYYKFKNANDIICRIPQATINAAGLAATNADHFQLWKNGTQVRLYTSVSNTALGSADFIEFFGEMNDGKADKQLYRKPEFQLADKYSLETDTSTYFLTVNPIPAQNLRYTNAINTAPSAATPEPYFMRTINVFYRNQINKGYGQFAGEYVYSSSYDNGEGYTSNEIVATVDTFNTRVNGVYTENITGLNVYTAGPANSVSVKANMYLNTFNGSRKVDVKLFNTTLYPETSSSGPLEVMVNATNLPLSTLQNTSNAPITFTIANLGTFFPTQPFQTSPNYVPNERMVIATTGITYPATFNFNNSKSFEFNLAASTVSNYLVIDNFNFGNTAPILYDVTTGARYVGEIASTTGKVKFVLPASTLPNRKCILNNIEANNITTIAGLEQKTFANYSTAANRGDYIIISNPILYNDGTGANQVEAYRAYRASINGGSYNAKIYDINELRDQFAYGLKSHPAAVRDFVRMISTQYPIKPKQLFIIGRGLTYQDRRLNESSPIAERLDLVTTFGWPSSDILMASANSQPVPEIPVGRLAAVNGGEVKNYLQKVIEYETNQRTPSPLIADKAWMKNIMQVVGGQTPYEQSIFNYFMDEYARIAKSEPIVGDSLFGGNVEKFSKTDNSIIQQASSDRINQLFQAGLGVISYFGHSSATTFEFNLGNPENYNNAGKYPFFNISGCNAGNFYNFDPQRLTSLTTLSEKYLFTPQRGSVGFLANTHFGIPGDLFNYDTRFYKNFSQLMYGKTVGDQTKEITAALGGNDVNLFHQSRIHLEEINLHGDPAIKLTNFAKPDFVIEPQLVKISPSIITVAESFFTVKIKMQNIGRTNRDSIRVSVKRLLPNTTVPVTVFDQLIASIKFEDSITLNLPINGNTDAGTNKIMVELDPTQMVSELYETNNYFTTDVQIFENALNPVTPYNYSIVNTQNISLYASTANPLLGQSDFVMELDTTELFNSPFKKTYNKSGTGGLIEFTPTNVTFGDSVVYYWRTAVVPVPATAAYIWKRSSFTYLANGTPGFNQQHYNQFQKSTYNQMVLGADRSLKFADLIRQLNIRTGIFPFFNFDAIDVNVDFFKQESYGCRYRSLQFYVFDSLNLNLDVNQRVGANGRFGSWPPDCSSSRPKRKFFEFPYYDAAYRKSAMDFIDSIPAGQYVAITNLGITSNTFFIDSWKADTALYGSNNSLYHKLKSIGFGKIDSFSRNLPFLYFYKKGSSSFAPIQEMGANVSDYVDKTINLLARGQSGSTESPAFGPAKKWKAMHWRGTNLDAGIGDTVKVQIWGVKANGTADLFATVDPAQDTTISYIDAAIYPYIKLRVNQIDKNFATPTQIRYLRLDADYLPEGAVAPNILYTVKDTVQAGEPIDFAVAFKNISTTKFDSLMRIKLVIKTQSNFDSVINIPRGKILIAGDTLVAKYKIPSENFAGKNTLFIEFNPNNDQAEVEHFNNILYKNFFVKADNVNPTLDVTFDGIHILNKDIVAAKPDIMVKLNDDSKYLGLVDNALLKVQIRYPDQTIRNYNFGTDTLRFTPANLAAGENTATINLKPFLPKDGEYELIVTGKDRSGNKAGAIDYHKLFTVINKPMISEMLNYPNPFTTSTAFVFTLTGSQVPQNIRIQVLTITGKVVREITKEELGPLHIGRNITSFKWDGTDMYGQQLANGVYIYRVLTNLNGNRLEKYKAEGDDTEKYFNKGYGKMYLMR